MRAAGRYRSTSKPPTYTKPISTRPAIPTTDGGWVGIDRGLSAFLVAATSDGQEVARVDDPPKALATGISKQQRLAKSLSRKKKGSHNRRDAAAKLARHHHNVANVRRHFLHQIAGALVKTHDRLVIEDLNIAGMLTNHRLARAISDAGWAEFARLLHYKAGLARWPGGHRRPLVPIKQAVRPMRHHPPPTSRG